MATTHDSTSMSHTIGPGTMKYKAPEVSQSKRYSPKSDIYSLGVIVQEIYDFDVYEYVLN